jgi:hypothetical protein
MADVPNKIERARNGSPPVQPLLPLGLKLLVAFFWFGTAMCLLTVTLLCFPGGPLDGLWGVNPEARAGFQQIGRLSFPLMIIVGLVCASAAIGIAARAEWGRGLALGVLGANLLGDLGNAIARNDYRTLIGLPIGAALIVYLSSGKMRRVFQKS